MPQKTDFQFRDFFGKKQSKFIRNEENCQDPNRSIKFSEILYVDASLQKKMLQKTVFGFRHFCAFFGQNTTKIDQK